MVKGVPMKNNEFDIEISGLRGYFEHTSLGEECSGRLWFNSRKELTDYDGVYTLPKEVVKKILQDKYKILFWDDGEIKLADDTE